ncbi:plasmid replication initiator RepA [Pantoea sp. Aalb]|uniref:plasmid replication initiator RepA n=1 Tax=Pantoea sp. Aalb TaxID=2576762 RepID=UPI001328A5AF|nr:plasmid replication initiator RepA [Pantoea sp. Aalb]MXP68013.1 incFII family plasmid replication initiator RepA [Pantoea sp. Aalb]
MIEQTFENTLFYRQVKNPFPEFIPEVGKKTLPFCEKLRLKAAGFTHRVEFQILVSMLIARGERKRRPPELRRRALEAALQAMCYYYNPLANRVSASLTTMSIRCGLATEKKRLSITRLTGALRFLSLLNLITYNTEYDRNLGCNIPTDITFKPLMWRLLDISEESVNAVRKSRAEWENIKREKKGLPRLNIDELVKDAWAFVRERFRSYHRFRREHGLKLYQARKDSFLSRKEIEVLVHKQILKEVRDGRLKGNLNLILDEIKRRVKERIVMSRGKYSRLKNDILLI